MTEALVDPLESALIGIDKLLTDYSSISLASAAEVCDGLLDLRRFVSNAIKDRNKEIDFALQTLAKDDVVPV